ncbi:MAG: hypothetical protein HJJLKODD_01004 [Phycisphaerae bacterium]|nr:hypothetical protein [Phycisphaerae bacterium]
MIETVYSSWIMLGALLPLIVLTLISDVQRRKLPNRLTLSTAVLGLLLHLVFGGMSALGWSLVGLLLGFFALLPFYLAHMLGAGDLKMFGALGAFLGYPLVWYGLAGGAILAGVTSLVIMLIMKREVAAGRWTLMAAKASSAKILFSDFASHQSLNQSSRSLPYSIYYSVAAVGVWVAQASGWLNA